MVFNAGEQFKAILFKKQHIYMNFVRGRVLNDRFLLFLLLRVEFMAIIMKLSLSIHDLH